MSSPITGYAEGYYGKLLSWDERRSVLMTLHQLGLNTYYYAPKEDVFHRLDWRQPYPTQWREQFRQFCQLAQELELRVVAGVAPGLDFDFAHLPDGQDFQHLLHKCQQLLDDGAQLISLLMDDIDDHFEQHRDTFEYEGQAHAALANALAEALTIPSSNQTGASAIWVTPRVYADELIADSPAYLPHFVATLDQQHSILYCGTDVVSQSVDEHFHRHLTNAARQAGLADLRHHPVIVWDNLYANDYCPRRLFIGPWQGRSSSIDVLLNPTGMINTDCMLLQLMAEVQRLDGDVVSEEQHRQLWHTVLRQHGVPEAFFSLATFFWHPVFNSDDSVQACPDGAQIREAIETCLWRWKTPLSREWYSALFGLKHDLLAFSGEHAQLRIRKTQTSPLARVLSK